MGKMVVTQDMEPKLESRLRSYYRLHARIYQATRWTFLFGRSRMIHLLKLPLLTNKTVLEVGCGTGHNLAQLAANHPNLQLIGIDISPEMLLIAAKKLMRYSRRIFLLEKAYGNESLTLPKKPDIILFSYCLTMINPGWERVVQQAQDDLEQGGKVAVVDFHGSPFSFFRRWMGVNHVRMEKHLLPVLEQRFVTVRKEIHTAYGGLWTYFIFIGIKKNA